jgi:hypothetical protein
MGLFSRDYSSLPQQISWPSLCRSLHIHPVDAHLQEWGPQFLQLSNLQSLHQQGDYRLYDRVGFTLPTEISQLRTLKRLVLFNLPIGFPEWIADLPNLRYLMVRGTKLTAIPPWIDQLSQLRALAVENGNLTALPEALRRMNHLRGLWLADTQLRDLRPEQFPQQLRVLSLARTSCYQWVDLVRLRQALKSTTIYPYPEA